MRITSELSDKGEKNLTESEREKLIRDLKYLVSVNRGETRREYEKQLAEIIKSRK